MLAIVLVVTMLAGCDRKAAAPLRPVSSAPRISTKPISDISITLPCLGSCPSYFVTVFPDGRGVFADSMFSTARDQHAFRITPTQFAAIAKLLALYRPVDRREIADGVPGECKRYGTDAPTTEVYWSAVDGTRQELSFYRGCLGDEYRNLANAIDTSTKMLPIAALIGKHGNQFGSTIVR